MKAAQPKTDDEMRMSAKEFDRIMGKALSVKPDDAKKQKRLAGSKHAKNTPKKG